jgi:hypothetical protein
MGGKGLAERLRPWNFLERRSGNEVGHGIEHVPECHVGHRGVQLDEVPVEIARDALPGDYRPTLQSDGECP